MQSFRSELEDLNNPIVEKDILELADKIQLFREGKIDEEKFKSLRLARGVYGQRQQGVQMIRIKLPYGKITAQQLIRIADISDKYSNGNLHTTTRQDIQIHHVSLDRTPELWAELEKDDITLREACGNTVRNVTASYLAGIDNEEPFDVSPYAQAFFEYFLRHAPNQELGRKIKVAFSSSDKDSALTFMHDLGFIPRLFIDEDGTEIRGFKVLVGGGLGAQPFLAEVAYEFLHEDQIIPFSDALLRVFDRHGERSRRHKARLKYLLDEIGLEKLLELVEEERIAVGLNHYKINSESKLPPLSKIIFTDHVSDLNIEKYDKWLKANVSEQKQKGYYTVGIKLTTGDINSAIARKLAQLVWSYAADDIRITPNQGLSLRFVRPQNLPILFHELNKISLANPGFDSVADITSCPGTDTCNLGITSSTGISRELEKVIQNEFPDLVFDHVLKIKISGCMNSCGQHSIANIGFHGSTLKSGANVLPALQVLLGGGILGAGNGAISDKVIKVPAKKGPDVLRNILNDYEFNSNDGEYFNDYYNRKGKIYFYDLLKPLADLKSLTESDFLDWGSDKKYQQAIGVGECAGVVIDLVATLLFDTEEKLEKSKNALSEGQFGDSIYFSYSTFISGAKAYLISKEEKTNSHEGIINDLERINEEQKDLKLITSFREIVDQIRKNEPSEIFAQQYLYDAILFVDQLKKYRERVGSLQLAVGKEEKVELLISDHISNTQTLKQVQSDEPSITNIEL
jgi:sulfite reductase (ferredoxin)